MKIEDFVTGIKERGSVLIPQIEIRIDGETRVFSLMSTRTTDESFIFLSGVQGQFVDRTEEWSCATSARSSWSRSCATARS